MKFLIILVLLVVGLRLFTPRLGNSVAGGIVTVDDHQTLAACPDTPNCHLDTFIIEADPAQAIDTMATIVAEQPGTQSVTRNDHYLHVTWSTRVMGFVDDVEFLVMQPDVDEAPVLQVRSASRLGKSDLGANAKRVEALRSMSRGRL